MLPSDGRAGTICVLLISVFFFITILGGGCLLILYIALPASDATSWFPFAGMVLIGIPWVFWTVIIAYRCVVTRLSPASADQAPFRAAVVAPAGGLNASSSGRGGVESPVGSPGGARRVRFGDATGDKGSAGVAG